jgi:hypothetical protein
MTNDNQLTRPFDGPQTRSQIVAGAIPTNFSWNFNPETGRSLEK